MSNSTTHEEYDPLFIPLNLESFRLGGAKPINPMLETLEGVTPTPIKTLYLLISLASGIFLGDGSH